MNSYTYIHKVITKRGWVQQDNGQSVYYEHTNSEYLLEPCPDRKVAVANKQKESLFLIEKDFEGFINYLLKPTKTDFENVGKTISHILDRHLPAKGVNTDREKIRIGLWNEIYAMVHQLTSNVCNYCLEESEVLPDGFGCQNCIDNYK